MLPYVLCKSDLNTVVEEKITLVPVAPLSNIGMALRLKPEIADKIERIVLMGGAYCLHFRCSYRHDGTGFNQSGSC